MRYELRLTAFDMLDQVHIAGSVRMTGDAPGDVSEPALQWTTSLPGTGQSDPAEWTTDTLLAALESL